MRSTKEQTAYILELKRQREATLARRHRRTLFAASAASLVLLAGVLFLLQNLLGWPFPGNKEPEPYEMKIVSLHGVLYTPIHDRLALFQIDSQTMSVKPGQPFGQVARAVAVDFLDPESVGIYANFLKVGTEILEWSGYSPEFRICARGKDGALTGLERIGVVGDFAADRPVAELLDFPEQVREILICNNCLSEIGRISDPAEVRHLMAAFAEKAVFAGENLDSSFYGQNQFYRLYLRLADNSVTPLIVHVSNGLGSWIESIRLPDGFANAISDHILGSLSEEWQNYGNICADADWGLPLLPEAAGLYRGDLYQPEQVWVDGNSGRLLLGHPDSWQVLLADDARGDVRIEGQHIYYLTTAGKAARILFEFKADDIPIHERALAGEDLSASVKARDILAAGPFVRLQVRLGVPWTLDGQGILRRNHETVARAVDAFSLDPLGVTYSSEGAIWRQRTGSQAHKLAATDAQTMATAGVYLYYSPAAGGIWRMRLDGTDNRKLWNTPAQKIVYKNSLLAVLERGTGRIFLSGNEDQLLETPYRSSDVDIGLYHGLVFIDESNGGLISIRYMIEWDGVKNRVVPPPTGNDP